MEMEKNKTTHLHSIDQVRKVGSPVKYFNATEAEMMARVQWH